MLSGEAVIPAIANINILPRRHVSSQETVPAEKEKHKSFTTQILEETAITNISHVKSSYQTSEVNYGEALEDIDAFEISEHVAKTEETKLLDYLIVTEPVPESLATDLSPSIAANQRAGLSILTLHSQQIEEPILAEREGNLELVSRPLSAQSKEQMIPHEGIEVEEIIENESERNLNVAQKDKSTKAKFSVPFNESLIISETITDDKTAKYYPELIVPTEAATESILEQKAYIAGIIDVEDKEGALLVEKAPTKQTAQINVKENIAMGQSLVSSFESSNTFKKQPAPGDAKAQEYIQPSESVIMSAADIQTPVEDLQIQYSYELKEAGMNIVKQQHLISSETTSSEILEELSTIYAEPKTAQKIVLTLASNEVEMPLVNEMAGDLEEEAKPSSHRAGISMTPFDSSVLHENQPLDTISDKHLVEKFVPSEANIVFQTTESTLVLFASIHDKEEHFEQQNFPKEQAQSKTITRTHQSVAIIETQPTECADSLSGVALPDEKSARVAFDGSELKAPAVLQIGLSDTVGPMPSDEKMFFKATPNVSVNESKDILEQCLLETSDSMVSPENPAQHHSKFLHSFLHSFEVSQDTAHEVEGKLEKPSVLAQNVKLGLPDTFKSAVVEETNTSDTVQNTPSETTDLIEASVKIEELMQMSITEVISCHQLQDISHPEQPALQQVEVRPVLFESAIISSTQLTENESPLTKKPTVEAMMGKQTLQDAMKTPIVSQTNTVEEAENFNQDGPLVVTAQITRDRFSAVSVIEQTPLEASDTFHSDALPQQQSSMVTIDATNEHLHISQDIASEAEEFLPLGQINFLQAVTKFTDTVRAINIEQAEPLGSAGTLHLASPQNEKAKLSQETFYGTMIEHTEHLENENTLSPENVKETKVARLLMDSNEVSTHFTEQTFEMEGDLKVPKVATEQTKVTIAACDALKSVVIEEINQSHAPGILAISTPENAHGTQKLPLLEETKVTRHTIYEEISESAPGKLTSNPKQATMIFETPFVPLTFEQVTAEIPDELHIKESGTAQAAETKYETSLKVPTIEGQDTILTVGDIAAESPLIQYAEPTPGMLSGKVISETSAFDTLQHMQPKEKVPSKQATLSVQPVDHLIISQSEIVERETSIASHIAQTSTATSNTDSYFKSVTVKEVQIHDGIENIDSQMPKEVIVTPNIEGEHKGTQIIEVAAYEDTQLTDDVKVLTQTAQLNMEEHHVPVQKTQQTLSKESQIPSTKFPEANAMVSAKLSQHIETSEITAFSKIEDANYTFKMQPSVADLAQPFIHAISTEVSSFESTKGLEKQQTNTETAKTQLKKNKLLETIVQEQTIFESHGTSIDVVGPQDRNAQLQLEPFKPSLESSTIEIFDKEDRLLVAAPAGTGKAVVKLPDAQNAYNTFEVISNAEVSNLSTPENQTAISEKTLPILESLQISDTRVFENTMPTQQPIYEKQQHSIELDSLQTPITSESLIPDRVSEGTKEHPLQSYLQEIQQTTENEVLTVSEDIALEQVGSSADSATTQQVHATAIPEHHNALEQIAVTAGETLDEPKHMAPIRREELIQIMQPLHEIATKQTTFVHDSEQVFHSEEMENIAETQEIINSETKTELKQVGSRITLVKTEHLHHTTENQHIEQSDKLEDLSLKSDHTLQKDEQLHSYLETISASNEKIYQHGESLPEAKPIFVTTFETSTVDGETIIKPRSKKITADEGVIVEEILSDTELPAETKLPESTVEIVEVNAQEDEDELVMPDTLTEDAPLLTVTIKEFKPENPILESIQIQEEVISEEASQPEVQNNSIDTEIAPKVEERPAEETVVQKLKKKKTIKKKKTDDHDEIIKSLLEQEVSKTELEKYEKIDIEVKRPKKQAPTDIVPTKIIVHQQTPTKLQIKEPEQLPQTVKLKPSKPRERKTTEEQEMLPKFKLKSRIVHVEYPPEPMKLNVTKLRTKRGAGELSRNVEEAEKLIKKKVKKFKHPNQDVDDLEKVELEKYEPYVSSSEDEEQKKPYDKSKPETPQVVPEEVVTISLGKGKKKPAPEDETETIKLKKIPEKILLDEEHAETTKKVPESEKDTKTPTHAEVDYTLEPFEPTAFEKPDTTLEELDDVEKISPQTDEKLPEKQKHKRKGKPKPEPETNEYSIVPGIPKPDEDQPDDTIKFRVPEKSPLEEVTDEVKLKPVIKQEDNESLEQVIPQSDIEYIPPASTSPSEDKGKEKKPKKTKPAKHKETKPTQVDDTEITHDDEQPKELIDLSAEEILDYNVTVKETPKAPAPEQQIEQIFELPKTSEEPNRKTDVKPIEEQMEEKPVPTDEFNVQVKEYKPTEHTEIEEIVIKKKKKVKPQAQEELPESVFSVKKPEKPEEIQGIPQDVQVNFQMKPEKLPKEDKAQADLTLKEYNILSESIEPVEEIIESSAKEKESPTEEPKFKEQMAVIEIKDEEKKYSVLIKDERPERKDDHIEQTTQPQQPAEPIFEKSKSPEQGANFEVSIKEEEKPDKFDDAPAPKSELSVIDQEEFSVKLSEAKPDEEQPTEAVFKLKKKPDSSPETEVEVKLVPKVEEFEETTVGTKIKKKKPSRKSPEEAVAELQVTVVQPKELLEQETIEKPSEIKSTEKLTDDVSFKVAVKEQPKPKLVEKQPEKLEVPHEVPKVDSTAEEKDDFYSITVKEYKTDELSVVAPEPKLREIPAEKVETIEQEDSPIEESVVVMKRKKTKKEQPEEEVQVTLGKPKETAQDEVVEEFVIQRKPSPEEVTADTEAEITIPEAKPHDQAAEPVTIKKKKQKKPTVDEASNELTIKKEDKQKESVEETGKSVDELDEDEKCDEKPSTKAEEDETELITLKKPTPKTKSEETEEIVTQITIPKKKPKDQVAESVTLKKKKPKKPVVDEAANELTIKKVIEDKPEELIEKEAELQEEEQPTKALDQEQPDTVTIQKAKPISKPEEPETEVTISHKKPELQVAELITLKKKKLKKPVIDEDAEELTIKKVDIIEETSTKLEEPKTQEELESQISIQPDKLSEQIVEDKTIKKKKPKKPTIESEDKLKLEQEQPIEDETAQVAFKLPQKPEKPVEEEVEAAITFSSEKPKDTTGEEVTIKKKKTRKPSKEDTADELTIKKLIVEHADEDQVTDVSMKLPKKDKKVVEDTSDTQANIQLPKEKPEDVDAEQVTLKKRKPKRSKTETAEDQLVLKKPVEKQPEQIVEEEVIEEAFIKKKKPKPRPTVENLEEEEVSLSLGKPKKAPEDVEEAATFVKKPKRQQKTSDEASAELLITKEEEIDDLEEVEEDIPEEFVVRKKQKPKPQKPVEEHTSEVTIKKLKSTKRPSRPDIPEYTDVENVTFRPKSVKTKEDVEQEFKISLDSYAEEEISMSGKVRLKKHRPKTYAEEADEAQIRIIQDWDDGEEPIIEEVLDDSEAEDNTMYDVDEPEEYLVTEDMPENVELKLKSRKEKPRYSVQHEDEEEILIGLRTKKHKDSVKYDEDSLTVKKKRKPTQKYLQEEASLSLTREMHIEDTDDENILYSICTYIADNEEAINLVEGEKVHVIARHSAEWWFVKKHLTEEQGWVPSQYLMDAESYAKYLEKKLHEKIDKLPVFEQAESSNPEPPLFVKRFEEQSVPQKATIKLQARVIGNPLPEISWLLNNMPLLPSEKVLQSYDGENIELTILNANSETDSGDYKCVASNPIGKASHGAKVIVEVDEVIFTKKLKKTVSIEECQSLTLECETSHMVSTKWYHNNKELTGMDHRVVVQDGKTHKLVIKNTTLKDAGTYKCTVKSKQTESTVEVLERKPEFIKRLQDYEVKETETAILDVEITSDTADVTWLKDGEKLVSENKNLQFIKEGKVRKLKIHSVTVHDEGEYTCTLEDQECSAELAVIELPPQIIRRLEDTTVTKGEKATFEIELTKGDALVKWFKDGNELHFSEHVQLAIDGKKQKLKVYKSSLEDAGEYMCQVGEQSSSAKLTVEEPIVDFTLKLPEVTLVPKSSDAEFTVRLSPDNEDVEVTWYKNGKKIKPSPKHTIDVDATIRRLVVHNAAEEDEAEYSCVAANAQTKSSLKVQEIQTPPVILSDKDQIYKAKQGDDVQITVKFNASPKPDATWTTSKKIIKKSKRMEPTIEEQSASLTIRQVVEEDAGDYNVRLVNPSGDAEANLHLIIMRPPSAPGAPEPLNIMHDSLTLYWKVPDDDGNNEIIEYVLEYQETTEKKWTQITKLKDTTYTITKLKSESSYVFRAIAVNEIGASPPSPLSPTIQIKADEKMEKPNVQQPLQDIVCEPNKSITLTCVFGGNPAPTIKWMKNSKVIESEKTVYENRVAKYVIEETTFETDGTYTCVAENEVGKAETTCKVTIQEKPKIEIEEKYLTQNLRTKTKWEVPAFIKGHPKPKIMWYKESMKLEESQTCRITTEEWKTTVCIEKLTRRDSGKYTLKAKNTAGETSVDVILKVIDKPSRPNSMEIKEVKKDAVTLEWEPPRDDGGLDITKYTLEKCDPENMVWMKVADIDRDITSYCIQKLNENSQYIFRVIAENPVGASEPIESDTITVKRKFERPSPPRPPIDVSGMTDTSFTLTWETPESDGGQRIIEYLIDMKEVSSSTYTKIGTSETTQIFVSNLTKDKIYQFRIYAKNEIGMSEALETEDKIIAGRRIIRFGENLTPPSAPQNLRAPDVTGRSVTLDWEVPASNGGSEITGYVIEKRTTTSTKWTKIVTLDAHCLQYTVDNLKTKCEYTFRVFAENSVGLSAPAVTETIVLKTHATVPSPPTAPLEIRTIAANASVFEWGIPESDGGAPLLGYNVAIRDMKKTMWIEVGRVPPDVQKFQIRDLQDGHEYMIRIYARNEIGLSEALESDEPYKVLSTGHEYLPDEPRTEATGISTENTSSWLRDHNMDADISSYAKAKLLRKDEYFFRIWHYAKKLFK